jgi:DNA (cytosine-5)-methyltransferase 1
MSPAIPLTAVELFSGLGGMGAGFMAAGYEVLFANDSEVQQLETWRLNNPGVPSSDADIRTLSDAALLEAAGVAPGELDVLLGGPPCQGFSTYGQRRADDDRNFLFREFARAAAALRPRCVVMENVVGLLSMKEGAVIAEILRVFREELGYRATLMVLDAANYGVPQYRRRVFIVGYRDGERAPTFPRPTHRLPPGAARRRGGRRSRRPAPPAPAEGTPPWPIGDQGELERHLTLAALPPALTVADALSDLPEEALPPRQVHTPLSYPGAPRTDYQRLMRGEEDTLRCHAAKRHMLRRQLRGALIDQGDYGAVVAGRLAERGVPADVVARVRGGDFTEADLVSIRDVDKAIEGQLLEALRAGAPAPELAGDLRAGGFANKYRRLAWSEPSHTLVAHMARDCSDFLHPAHNRPITVREAARLQSFPDRFRFAGSHFRQLRGLGNAVPPLLAYALATHIRHELPPTL